MFVSQPLPKLSRKCMDEKANAVSDSERNVVAGVTQKSTFIYNIHTTSGWGGGVVSVPTVL